MEEGDLEILARPFHTFPATERRDWGTPTAAKTLGDGEQGQGQGDEEVPNGTQSAEGRCSPVGACSAGDGRSDADCKQSKATAIVL